MAILAGVQYREAQLGNYTVLKASPWGLCSVTLNPNLPCFQKGCRRRVQSKKGYHKSNHKGRGPHSPFFRNQVLFSSYMSKEGSMVENSLSYTRLRGDKEFR